MEYQDESDKVDPEEIIKMLQKLVQILEKENRVLERLYYEEKFTHSPID